MTLLLGNTSFFWVSCPYSLLSLCLQDALCCQMSECYLGGRLCTAETRIARSELVRLGSLHLNCAFFLLDHFLACRALNLDGSSRLLKLSIPDSPTSELAMPNLADGLCMSLNCGCLLLLLLLLPVQLVWSEPCIFPDCLYMGSH